MGQIMISSEITQRVMDSKEGVIFKTPVIEDKSLEEMLEYLGLKEKQNLGFKFEDSKRGLMLCIETFNVDSSLELLEKFFYDGKTDIYFVKPTRAAE